MNLARTISAHRPEVILAVLSVLSLASLASGASSTIIHNALTRAVSITGYPILAARTAVEEGIAYTFDFIWNYNALRRENAKFRQVQAELEVARSRQEELAAENRRIRSMLGFARSEPRYTLMPARDREPARHDYRSASRHQRTSLPATASSAW